jgi:hypothetical protein
MNLFKVFNLILVEIEKIIADLKFRYFIESLNFS